MRLGTLLVFLVLIGILAGCASNAASRVEVAPAIPQPIPPTAMAEKVVQMVTMTPTFDNKLGTPTPYIEMGGTLPTPTAFSLRDWGAPVTAYSDRTAGFAFECPADWNVSPPSEDDRKGSASYTIVLRSTSPIMSLTKKDEAPRMGAVDITVSNDGKRYTLDEATAWRKKELAAMDGGWTVTAEGLWTLPSGITVMRFELDTPIGPARETIAIINGRRVIFTGTESLELFNSIAMSLQLE